MSETNVPTTEVQLVVFELDGQAYGVDIAAVREVVRMHAMTRAPQGMPPVAGIVSLQGRSVPVIDLRKRMGLQPGKRTDRSRVMVVNAGGHDVGITVDAVTEACRVPEGHVQQSLDEGPNAAHAAFVSGAVNGEERRILLIDPAQLLSPDEAGQIAAFAEAA